jgi:ribosome-binding protein aMBF1 (putative translation factor)
MIAVMVTAAERQRVGTLIKKRRQELGIRTQAELAVQVGTSKTSVAKWEAGKYYPSRNLGTLEAVLGISLTEDAADPVVQNIRAMAWLTRNEQDDLVVLYEERKSPRDGAQRAG